MCAPLESPHSAVGLFEKSCYDFGRILLAVARTSLVDLRFDDGLADHTGFLEQPEATADWLRRSLDQAE